jgi:DNA-binding transcriptional LysR family regulator
MDRLHSMRVFVCVIDHGSFAAAARAMGLSPAVVTRLVADLESHLGSRLIHRTTRRLALTDAGALYLDRVRHILTEVDDAEALAATRGATPLGRVRLQCPPALFRDELAAGLATLLAAHPRLTLEVVTSEASQPKDDRIDLAIVPGGPTAPTGWQARRLARTESVLCAAPVYLDRQGRPRAPADLAEHALLLPPGARSIDWFAAHWNDDDFPGAALPFAVGPGPVSSLQPDILQAAAEAGLGIAALPSYRVAQALIQRRLERVLPEGHLGATTLWACVPAQRHVPARVRVVLDHLVDALGGDVADRWLRAAGCETRPAGTRDAAQAALSFDA